MQDQGPQDINVIRGDEEEEVTPTIQGKDDKIPQVEINYQLSEQASSLADLASAYSEDSE